MFQAVIFYTCALLAILSGISVVTRRNPIASAVSLVVCFFFLSALYVLLDAHFVAVTQVLVYAGAIMVLFIFVIMVLNLRDDDDGPITDIGGRAIGGLAVAGLLGIGLITAIDALADQSLGPAASDFGTIESVGIALFGGAYLLPFEVVSILLTVAMVGAVVLAKRNI
jgi:NADH-quinone oxidoreductase subunit J